MNDASRRSGMAFLLATLAYVILLPVSGLVIRAYPHAWWRVLVALLPVVPGAIVVIVALRFLSRLDELQRKIQGEALAFGFGATAILTFSYGSLQNVGFPDLSWTWIWPLMALLWLIGLVIATRRYAG